MHRRLSYRILLNNLLTSNITRTVLNKIVESTLLSGYLAISPTNAPQPSELRHVLTKELFGTKNCETFFKEPSLKNPTNVSMTG